MATIALGRAWRRILTESGLRFFCVSELLLKNRAGSIPDRDLGNCIGRIRVGQGYRLRKKV